MSSSGSGVSDSQTSQASNFSLHLSQETTNQLLSAVGVTAIEGDSMIQHYHSEFGEDEEEEELPIPNTSISVSRTVFNLIGQTQQSLLHPSTSHTLPLHSYTSPLGPGKAPPAVLSSFSDSSTPSTPHLVTSLTPSPAAPYPAQFTFDAASTLPTPALTPALTPPTLTPPSVRPSCALTQPYTLRTNIPINLPYPGEYDFGLVFNDDQRKKLLSKNATFTYSNKTQRMYIKRSDVIPFNFTINRPPPPSSIIRAMAIHKAPEMISERLTCCPKHVDEQQKKGSLCPHHFIRSLENQKHSYQEDEMRRLSVVVPFTSVMKKSEDVYIAFYQFPCFTSEVHKTGQTAQIVFTLECCSQVLGRCTVDIRVCASPGRDRNTDEKKLSGDEPSSSGRQDAQTGVTTRRGRKRGASSNIVQCTLPPKQLCMGLSGTKVQHSVMTYPELIPYVDTVVRMIESVYSMKVQTRGEAAGPSDRQAAAVNGIQETFTSLDGWLEHLELMHYKAMLEAHGVRDLFQVPGVTDEELKKWGMTSAAHRKLFQEGKSKIHLIKQEESMLEGNSQDTHNESSPALFPSSPSSQPVSLPPSQPPPLLSSQLSQGSHLSQLSSTSTQPFSQAVEVVHIQMRKNFSSQL